MNVSGVALAIGAGAAYAVFTVASKGLLEKQPPEAAMAVIFCLGAVLLLPLLLTVDLGWLKEPRGLAVALELGLVTVALGYTLFARGLSSILVATATTLSLAEPLTAGMLGVIVLGEALTPMAFLGILLIYCGLAILSVRRRPELQPSEPESG